MKNTIAVHMNEARDLTCNFCVCREPARVIVSSDHPQRHQVIGLCGVCAKRLYDALGLARLMP